MYFYTLRHLAEERDCASRPRLVALLGPGRLKEEFLELGLSLVADGEVQCFGRNRSDLMLA